MQYIVPFIKPRQHYQFLKNEVDAAITDTLARGDLVLRQQLRGFERNLAEFVNTKYAVGLNSGFHALHFSLLAAGIKEGDEVITVGHTFVATVSAIVFCGATPVLVDVGDDFNMDPSECEKAITDRTKAIIPVHLNGRLCAMDKLMEIANRHRLVVVEDAAQALGATFDGKMAGSFGNTGCFSFYPFKALGGIGDGGALTTDDEQIARVATLLRFNGEDRETGEYRCHGYTALLDNVQAAVLDVKLRHLPDWILHRRTIAERYHQGLRDVVEVSLPLFDQSRQFDTFQNYVIKTRDRERLRSHLKDNGIETLVHWKKPMWCHPGLGLDDPHLNKTERLCNEVISLPMSAETTIEEVDIVTATIRDFFRR